MKVHLILALLSLGMRLQRTGAFVPLVVQAGTAMRTAATAASAGVVRVASDRKTTSSSRSSRSSSSVITVRAEMNSDTDVDGLKNAPYILAFVFALSVWSFSIPPDFRRARFCSEQQVIDNPGSRCTTFEDWRDGIVEYYKNGGGVQFDFSVEKEGNVWVGGDKIDYSVPVK